MNQNRGNNSKPTSKRNTLGVDRAVYTQLLKKLDHEHENTADPTNPSRVHTRLQYHQPFLDLDLQTRDRIKQSITVAARNISRGGLSVLHSSYTYTGTRICTHLIRIDGKAHQATGTVVRCDHRGGVVHEIGIRFDQHIIVQEFIRPDIIQCIRTHERVKARDLEASLLVVGQDECTIPFVREFLQPSSVKYAFAESANQALQREPHKYDIILCCLDAGEMTGPEFARTLREAKYSRPVLLIGSCLDASTRNQIRLSTADAFIHTPIDENALLCALGEYMLTPWDERILAAVRDHHAAQTVEALRTELTKQAVLLDQHIRISDPLQVFATCNKIRSIAPLLGLSDLRQTAQSVAESVAQSGDIEQHAQALGQIKAMCVHRPRAA